MEEPAQVVTSEDLHTTYLDRSRRDLQKKIEQLKRALAQEHAKLAAVTGKRQAKGSQAGDVASIGKKDHLDAVAAAYREVSDSEPFLPFPDSVLPALIALRTTNATISESRTFLASQRVSLDEAKDRLETEKASLADQNALTKALENRIQSLRDGIESRNAMTPSQITEEKIAKLSQQIKDTDDDTYKLRQTMEKFIEGSLAAMLAAEEIGGPVAGDLMDVDSDTLEAGFTATGKRKKSRAGASPDKRQRRIDDMFGGDGEQGGAADESGKSDKRAAAREQMRELVTELVNKLLAAGGSSTDAYVHIPEESASVRFLIRVKAAEFHPRDSKRLRLVDFGREIGE